MKSESEVAQSCPTLCDPMDCSLPGSSLHGILQARVLEWVAISSSTLHPFTEHNALKVHPGCRMCRDFGPLYCWILLHCKLCFIHPEMGTARYPITGGRSPSSFHQLPSIPSMGALDSFTLFLSGRYLSGFQLSIAKNSGKLGGNFQSMEVHILPTHRAGWGVVLSFVLVFGFFLNENRILPKAFCPPNRHLGVVTYSSSVCTQLSSSITWLPMNQTKLEK